MKKLIKPAKKFLHNRFSGNVSKDIKDIKEVLKIIDNIAAPHDFWLSWYKSYLEDLLSIFKLNYLFIPKKYRNASKTALEKLAKDEKVVIKDINLPLPEKGGSASSLVTSIIESFLYYLLENTIDEETLLSIFYSILNEGLYEYKTVKLEKDDIVIDAGAYMGEFSALAGVKGCKAYAFEPMPNRIEEYLSKTADWNPNITICPYALSDKKDELIFEESMGSLDSLYVKKSDDVNKVKVQAIDLDTFVEENKLPRVDFIKADIEGAERHMLMGAQRVLKEFAPKIAICKYHLPDDPQVLRKLILDANPNYIIEERWKKIYAYVAK